MKVLRITYWFICCIFLVNVLAYYNFGISLPGYFSDIVLFWTWLCLTVVVIILNFKKSWAKVYAVFFGMFIVLTMIPMMIPFGHIVGFAFGGNRLYNHKFNSKYRIEKVYVLGLGLAQFQLVEKYGFYEKVIGFGKVGYHPDENLKDALSIRLLSNSTKSKFTVEFVYSDTTILKEFKLP